MSERSAGTTVGIVTAGAITLVVVLAAGAAAGLATLAALGAGPAPSAAAGAIPPAYLALYQQAATTCPGLSWTVLAAIGTVESDNGQSTLPGVTSGVKRAGIASGRMQFEQATFAAYALPVPPGGANPPSPYDPTDAIYAAARDLCANGARGGTNVARAVYASCADLLVIPIRSGIPCGYWGLGLVRSAQTPSSGQPRGCRSDLVDGPWAPLLIIVLSSPLG